MITVNGHQINVTTFPDGTSQVWKLSDELIDSTKEHGINLTWYFENESEFVHLLQTQYLIRDIIEQESNGRTFPETTLTCPYMPYARQDKKVANDSCFALNMFLEIFDSAKCITTFDVHNPKIFEGKNFEFVNLMPYSAIQHVINQNGIDLIVYPDKGAANRYNSDILGLPFIALDKVRDQSTGAITGLSINEEDKGKGSKILVVDDICDGGRTFIEAAKLLEGEKFLYVSHGIFSKGLDCLYDAGYTAIYTVNDLSTKTFGLLTRKSKDVVSS